MNLATAPAVRSNQRTGRSRTTNEATAPPSEQNHRAVPGCIQFMKDGKYPSSGNQGRVEEYPDSNHDDGYDDRG